MDYRLLSSFLLLLLSLPLGATAVSLETVVENVVHRHMTEKQIPGMSIAIVQDGRVLFSGGYGKASVEFDIPASPGTVYPISSVSKIFAGLLAARLVDKGMLDLEASIAKFFEETPPDKRGISVRHLLQHTHGLEDSYRSDAYRGDTGKSVGVSTALELARWSLNQPLRFSPGTNWEYSLAGYVMLAKVLELAGGMEYEALVEHHVFKPIGMTGTFGGTESVVAGRNPVLYKLVDNELAGHVVEFSPSTYAAGGLNTSVQELSKLFLAIAGDEFIDSATKRELWRNPTLASGKPANYGLGWFSYETSRGRWVVGHEGGGASWLIYYPDLDLAVIALSNMSGARADSLPYDVAREAMAEGLLRSD